MESFLRKIKSFLFKSFQKTKFYISEYKILLESGHQEVAKASLIVILIQTVLLCCFFSDRGNINDEKNTDLHTDIASTIFSEMSLQTQNAPTQTLIPNTPTPQPTGTIAPTKNQLELIYAQFDCLPRNSETIQGEVVEVIDGDTIKVKIGLETYSLRYIGIDCPECSANSAYSEIYGEEALEKNKAMVEGKEVLLIKDVSDVDQYNRLLRYVFVDTIFVNYEMVRQGYAHASTYTPDESCAEFLANAENTANQMSLGFWSSNFIPPTAIPEPTEDPRSGCDPCYPSVCIPDVAYDLDCGDIPFRRFSVPNCDPHGFDGDNDGIGCER